MFMIVICKAKNEYVKEKGRMNPVVVDERSTDNIVFLKVPALILKIRIRNEYHHYCNEMQ